MPTRVRIYVPTEAANDGDIIELYGPGSAGSIDWGSPLRRGRTIVRRGMLGRGSNGPEGLGPAGAETRQIVLRSRPLTFGLKEFAVRRYDLWERRAAVDPSPVEIFVNSAPPSSEALIVVDGLGPSGELRFGVTPGEP